MESLEDRRLLATLTVTGTGDTVADDDGQLTLREALIAANTNVAVDGSDAGEGGGVIDVIEFAPEVVGEIELLEENGQLEITETVEIRGPGANRLTIDAGFQDFRVLDVTDTAGDVTLSGLTFTGGQTTGDNVIAETTHRGGGIRSLSAGTLTIQSSVITGNLTRGDLASGGGVDVSAGELLIRDSTISNNRTYGDGAVGGGLATGQAITIVGSTFSGNSTFGDGAAGGGLALFSSNSTIENSTITENTTLAVDANGGGLYSADAPTIRNSIIAGNQQNGGSAPGPDLDTVGGLTITHSIVGNNDGSGLTEAQTPDADGNLIGQSTDEGGTGLIDPLLGALAFTGGTTPTHALLPGSPAIDAGDPAFDGAALDPPITTDQRGMPFARVVDGGTGDSIIDIGSFERQPIEGLDLVVDSSFDELDDDFSEGDFSLREAIALANANPGPDSITFDSELFIGQGGNVIFLAATFGQLVIADDLVIERNFADDGAVVFSALTNHRVFHVTSGAGDVALTGLGIIQGFAESGAGIQFDSDGELALTEVEFGLNRSSELGGAINSENGGTLRIDGSAFFDNAALTGGAIYSRGGQVLITNSEISTNGSDFGGGGLLFVDAMVTVANSTISGNTVADGDGGGVLLEGSTLTISNSTIADNTATGSGGGVLVLDDSELNATSTIFADNTAPTGADVSGAFTSATNNLLETLAGATGIADADEGDNIVGQDPMLGPLVSNGAALTLTHAILVGSPAIDAGANPDDLDFDQRGEGFARVVGAAADIGAFEQQTLTLTSLTFNGQTLDQSASVETASDRTLTIVAEFAGVLGNIDSDDIVLVDNRSMLPIEVQVDDQEDSLGVTTLTLISPESLPDGAYTLTLTSDDGAFESVAGVFLDGEPSGDDPAGTPTGDGTAGGDYTLDFVIDTADDSPLPLERVAPLGSLIASSQDRDQALLTDDDSDTFTLVASAGQTILIAATPASDSNLSVILEGPGGPLATGVVDDDGAALISPVTLPDDGTYTITVSGDAATAYTLDAVLNAASESIQVDDIDDASELSIDNTRVDVDSGSGRVAVLGESLAANAFLSATLRENALETEPDLFVDISATGTPLGLGDDDEAPFTSTVGNSLFPAGELVIANNGGIIRGGGLPATNFPLPGSPFTSALLPFWDDIDSDSGDVFVQELEIDDVNVLIVQWHQRPHFSVRGEATFQLQLFESGAVLARFVYPDVTFEDEGVDGGASATIGVQRSQDDFTQFSLDEASLSDGDVIDIVQVDAVIDVDEYTIDVGGKAGQPIEVVFSAMNDSDVSRTTVELLDADGTTVLATAESSLGGEAIGNFDLGIFDVEIPEDVANDAVYTVRVTSLDPGTYNLVVTDSLAFDVDGFNTVRDITRSGNALGSVDSTVFEADFSEDGSPSLDGFTIDAGDTTLWSLSTGRGSDDGHSGPDSLYYGQGEGPDGGGDYGTGAANRGSVTSPTMSVPANSLLAFNYFLESEFFDAATVSVRVEGEDSFAPLQRLSDTGGQFQSQEISLSAFAGMNVQVRFEFDTFGGIADDFEGWYLDDVIVGTSTDGEDRYTIDLEEDQAITVGATALFDLADATVLNNLDAAIEILGPDGESIVTNTDSLDGKNPLATFVASEAGQYTIVVTGESGFGEYVLQTSDAVFDPVVTQSDDATTVTEGGDGDSYQIALQAVPLADVTFTITPDAQVDLGAGAGTAITLTFTPENALVPQTVSVSAEDDDVVEASPHAATITHTVASEDPSFDGLAVGDLSVNVTDNDFLTPAIIVTADDPNNLDTIPVSIDFDGAVTGFDADDLAIANATAGNITGDADTGVFNFEITPDADGLITIDIAAAAATDAGSKDTLAATQVSLTSDRTGPALVAPADLSVEGDAVGGSTDTNADIVAFLAGAMIPDGPDAAAAITNDAPESFSVGDTIVTFSADDALGNTTMVMATITVTDTTAPTLTAPDSITVEGDAVGGSTSANAAIAALIAGATVTDVVDDDITITSDAPANFPVGDTTVTFTATDDAGNEATATTVITVADTTSPTITAPDAITVTANVTEGAEATLAEVVEFLAAAMASDTVDDDVTITNDVQAVLPVGETTVTFTATDDAGNEATATAVITVEADSVNTPILDVTGNQTLNAFQDGILIVRFMLGQPDANLEDPRLFPADATRTTGAEIRAHLEAGGDALDVNGDGNVNAFQDGILIVRYLLGQPDANLEDSRLITPTSTRNTGAAIRAYLDTLIPTSGESEFFADFDLGNGEGEADALIRTMINPVDVNGDGRVSAVDALNVVNQLARTSGSESFPWSRHDVNGDGRVSAVDALNVINRLAAAGQTQAGVVAPLEVSTANGESEQPLVLDPESSIDSSSAGKQASFDSAGTPQAVDSVFESASDDDFTPGEASSVDQWIGLLGE